MGILRAKIKGAGLLESLVAMVMIVICLGIAMMVYVNIMNGDNKRLQLHARLQLNIISAKTCQEKLFVDERIETDKLIIEKSLSAYQGSTQLQLLTLKAFDKNTKKLLVEQSELINND